MDLQRKHFQLTVPLAVLRARHGRMSRLELSRRTGIAERNLYRLEKGETKQIHFDTITKLCLEFGISPGDLLQLEEAPAPEPSPPARSAEAVPIIGNYDDPETMAFLQQRRKEALKALHEGRTIPAAKLRL